MMSGSDPVYAEVLVDLIFKLGEHVTSDDGDDPVVEGSDDAEDESDDEIRDLLIAGMTEFLRKDVDWQFSLWSTQTGKDGKTFLEGDQWWNAVQKAGGALTPENFTKLASSGLYSLVDGGYTDDTAVATAVAQGATEVTAFMDFEKTILTLFGTAPESTTMEICPGNAFSSQAFAESASSIQQGFLTKGTNLKLTANSSVVERIMVWSTKATTVDNPWFGITGGRQVQLNFISIQSSMPIGFDYTGQSDLISEVASSVALPENRDAAAMMWKWLAK